MLNVSDFTASSGWLDNFKKRNGNIFKETQVCSSTSEDNTEIKKEVIDVPHSPITLQEAYQGFDKLRKYVEENAANSKIIDCCNLLEEFLYSEKQKKSAIPHFDSC